mmetsp:Transcript_62505/g.167638  ORF Transcript_62505/g.167638 Transcript_62505/m.167638 type:complete len:81 (-) Transcript_62505:221-463(-)|eukprot:CAMPEP_0113666204 /NCGR_PEP_ID=MMETSP0038_2-20120614/2737_1 /TAXON_ID=2898 /ORGANISM="Cryptomonas paramecium" /LENGTH=80 /DNA_ID=CAMNT_0000581655 /DNA_START=67 /DNA_END=309 /DNA_ORIENTATION=- /assembly_acc=CAM_ASM_000170
MLMNRVVTSGGKAPLRMVLLHKTGQTDAWRKHPDLSTNNFKRAAPGLLPAIGLFVLYVAADKLIFSGKKKQEQGHGHGHH